MKKHDSIPRNEVDWIAVSDESLGQSRLRTVDVSIAENEGSIYVVEEL